MADSKITALTALTAADPANDMMPIVDVSDTSMAASGTTKRISINNILACSPAATLASATITGALTVNGGVNLANATAVNFGGLLTIYSDTAAGLFIRGRTTGGTTFQTQDGTNPLLNISNAGVFSWYDGAGGTRMTLNSTGLLVGTTSAGGSASNSAKSVAGFFSTVNGSTASTASGVAVTMFASPNEATFIVSAYIFGTGAPATYNAVAIVKVSGGVATVTTISSSTSTTISVSGLNIQATQTSGAAQVIVYSAIRIS